MKLNKRTATPEEAADKMLKFAHSYVTKMQNAFESPESMRIYYKDASDFCGIAELIAKSDFKKAVKTAYDMDTCPRDEIPQDVWDYITHHSRV